MKGRAAEALARRYLRDDARCVRRSGFANIQRHHHGPVVGARLRRKKPGAYAGRQQARPVRATVRRTRLQRDGSSLRRRGRCFDGRGVRARRGDARGKPDKRAGRLGREGLLRLGVCARPRDRRRADRAGRISRPASDDGGGGRKHRRCRRHLGWTFVELDGLESAGRPSRRDDPTALRLPREYRGMRAECEDEARDQACSRRQGRAHLETARGVFAWHPAARLAPLRFSNVFVAANGGRRSEFAPSTDGARVRSLRARTRVLHSLLAGKIDQKRKADTMLKTSLLVGVVGALAISCASSRGQTREVAAGAGCRSLGDASQTVAVVLSPEVVYGAQRVDVDRRISVTELSRAACFICARLPACHGLIFHLSKKFPSLKK